MCNSPKIAEEIIPKLYILAKTKGVKMTTLVNDILKEAINKIENKDGYGLVREE